MTQPKSRVLGAGRRWSLWTCFICGAKWHGDKEKHPEHTRSEIEANAPTFTIEVPDR